MPGLSVSSRAPRWKMASRSFSGSRPVVFDEDVDRPVVWLDRHEHAPAAIFCGIFDEVAEHFIQVLPFHADLSIVAARDVDRHILVEPVDRSLNGLQAFPDRGPRLHGRAPAC